MLSRRHLRIRVMQALYAWSQSADKSAAHAEKELMAGTERLYDLYLHLLQFFRELVHMEELYFSDAPASALTGQKKQALRYLKDHPFLQWLESAPVKEKIKKHKISWQQDTDSVKKFFFELRKSDLYKEYTLNRTAENDIARQIAKDLCKKELVRHVIEEKNLYWAEGFDVICSMLNKTIESGKEGFTLFALFKDEEEDMQFMRDLLLKTIQDDSYFTSLISERTESWDTERIALVDIVLMKMALCEIIHLSNIPVKVSINEYIDISKDYSTPNSKGFINGVVDNIVMALKKEGRIVKTGRGLLE